MLASKRPRHPEPGSASIKNDPGTWYLAPGTVLVRGKLSFAIVSIVVGSKAAGKLAKAAKFDDLGQGLRSIADLVQSASPEARAALRFDLENVDGFYRKLDANPHLVPSWSKVRYAPEILKN